MGHRLDRTFQSYINRVSQVHTQAVFANEEPDHGAMDLLSHQAVNRDPRAQPSNMVLRHQPGYNSQPGLSQLLKKRDDAKFAILMTGSTVRDAHM
ncbi:hypothetical protein EJ06DRAFT_534208, partial [Trichodelitschia bisporula]